MMRATTRSAAAFLALALALTACGDDGNGDDGNGDAAAEPDGDDDRVDIAEDAELNLVSDGVLTVCTEAPYEPFEFEDPDHPTGYAGFDMELMYEIAQLAQLDMEVVNTGFDALTSGAAMTAGTCDVAASAITILPEREENVDFTAEYYESLQSLLVPEDSEIGSLEDLTQGVTVGVQSGTTGEDYADENVPGASIQAFEGGGDLVTALAAGSIDAILQDLPRNEAVQEQDDRFQVVEEYDTEEVYGFALQQDRDDDLLDVLNRGLQELRDNGTYDELFEQYFVTVE
jgi:polar amino acid transport system substrate-binding protein